MQELVELSSTTPLYSCRSHLSHPTPTGFHQYLPQSARIQEPHDASKFVDGSGPIFSMYLEMATEEDKKMAEDWKADADGILIFVRLYHLIWCLTLTQSL